MRVNINKPNEKQRLLLREQCIKEFDKLTENMNNDVFVQLLHFFHFKRGYGQKRLETLVNDLKGALDGIHARYELNESDTTWICEKQLKDAGIDVDKLLKE